MSKRTENLLRKAGEALNDGRDPFETWFLSEHQVTLDEVYGLSETLGEMALARADSMRAMRVLVKGER